MPKLGLTMKTGKVARWLVAEGASVHQGDEIFEVETDKITNKIECPADGVLLQILVPQGEVVEVGTVLGLLGEAGEAVATKPATAAPEAQAEAAPDAAAPAAQAPVKAAGSYILATPRAKALARFLEMDLCFVTPTGRNGRIREADVLARQDVLSRIAITPLARVLASQAGLDICTLTGTGEGGKIVKADVERALNSDEQGAFYDFTLETDPQILRAVSTAQTMSGSATVSGVNAASSEAASSEAAPAEDAAPEAAGETDGGAASGEADAPDEGGAGAGDEAA